MPLCSDKGIIITIDCFPILGLSFQDEMHLALLLVAKIQNLCVITRYTYKKSSKIIEKNCFSTIFFLLQGKNELLFYTNNKYYALIDIDLMYPVYPFFIRLNSCLTCAFVIISLQRYLFRLYPFKVGVILISTEISSH